MWKGTKTFPTKLGVQTDMSERYIFKEVREASRLHIKMA